MNQKTLSSKDLGITYNSGPRTKLLALMIVLLILSMCLNQRHKAKCSMSCGNTCVLSRLLQYWLKSSDHINYADISTLNLVLAYFRVPYELSLCFMPYPKENNVQQYYSLLYYHRNNVMQMNTYYNIRISSTDNYFILLVLQI